MQIGAFFTSIPNCVLGGVTVRNALDFQYAENDLQPQLKGQDLPLRSVWPDVGIHLQSALTLLWDFLLEQLYVLPSLHGVL